MSSTAPIAATTTNANETATRRRRRRWPFVALFVLAWAIVGCTSTITPPQNPVDPVTVYVLLDDRHQGLILPRRAIEQANSPDLIPIQKSELKPGDLVFFNTLRHTFSHVGIYIGDDKFIHSHRAGGQVRVEDMRQAYWQQRFDGARRAPKVGANIQPGSQTSN